MEILLLAIISTLFMVIGVPVSMALGLGCLIAVAVTGFSPVSMVVLQATGSLNSFLLIAVPFFALLGLMVCEVEVGDAIFDFANDLVGWARGGLGHVNVVVNFIFGGMSGSGSADVLGLGPMEIAQMNKRGFPLPFTVGLTGTTAILATLVPPSINMVVFAAVSGSSVGACLLSGVGPGVVLALFLMVYIWLKCSKSGWGEIKPFSPKDLLRSLLRAFPALCAPGILMAGIFSGQFTPTEASLASVLYVLIISFMYKRMSIKAFLELLVKVTSLTGAILLVFCSASVVSFILVCKGAPNAFASAVLAITDNPILILLLINVVLLGAGCVLDSISAMIILVPLFIPLAIKIGVDPLHLATLVVANLGMGMLTPPVGTALYALVAVSGLPMQKVVRSLVPYYVVFLCVLAIITYVPWISTFFPRLLLGR